MTERIYSDEEVQAILNDEPKQERVFSPEEVDVILNDTTDANPKDRKKIKPRGMLKKASDFAGDMLTGMVTPTGQEEASQYSPTTAGLMGVADTITDAILPGGQTDTPSEIAKAPNIAENFRLNVPEGTPPIEAAIAKGFEGLVRKAPAVESGMRNFVKPMLGVMRFGPAGAVADQYMRSSARDGYDLAPDTGKVVSSAVAGATAYVPMKAAANWKSLPLKQQIVRNLPVDLTANMAFNAADAFDRGEKLSARSVLGTPESNAVGAALSIGGTLLGARGRGGDRGAPEAQNPVAPKPDAPDEPPTIEPEGLNFADEPPRSEPLTPQATKGFDATQWYNPERTRLSSDARKAFESRIEGWAKANGEDPKTVEPWTEIEERAKEVGLGEDYIKNELGPMVAKGQYPGRAVVHAVRETHSEVAQRIGDEFRFLEENRGKLSPAEVEFREKQLELMNSDAESLESVLFPARTDAGRNLRAWAMTVGLNRESMLARLTRNKGNKLSGEERSRAIDIHNRLVDARKSGDHDAVGKVWKEWTDFNAKFKRTNPIDAAAMTMKAAMLTAIKGRSRDLSSNAAMGALKEEESVVGSIVDYMVSKISGQRAKLNTFEAGVSPKMLHAAAKQAVRDVRDTVRYGTPEYNLDRMISSGIDPRRMNTGIKPLDKYVNGVFQATGATDLPFWHFARLRAQEEMARLIAINEKKAGTLSVPFEERVAQIRDNPNSQQKLTAILSTLEEFAEGEANNATFRSETRMSQIIGGAKQKLRNPKETGRPWIDNSTKFSGKLMALGMDALVPFERTGTNVWYEGARRIAGPAKLPFATVKTVYKAFKGTLSLPEQRMFSELAARSSTGVAGMWLGWMLFGKGILGGMYEKNEGQRNRDEIAGRTTGTARNSETGKNYRVMDIAAPFSQIVNFGATLNKLLSDPNTEKDKRGYDVLVAAFNMSFDQPMMQGLREATRIGQTGDIPGYLGARASAFVPGIVGDIAAATDPVSRETKRLPGEPLLTGAKRQVMKEIPILRKQLPERVDASGRTVQEPSGVMWNPLMPKQGRADKLSNEMLRLRIPISRAEKKETESTDDYIARLKAQHGERWKIMSKFVETEGYDRMTDSQRSAWFERAMKFVSGNTERRYRPSPLRRALQR